jgi:hypothetical protein
MTGRDEAAPAMLLATASTLRLTMAASAAIAARDDRIPFFLSTTGLTALRMVTWSGDDNNP